MLNPKEAKEIYWLLQHVAESYHELYRYLGTEEEIIYCLESICEEHRRNELQFEMLPYNIEVQYSSMDKEKQDAVKKVLELDREIASVKLERGLLWRMPEYVEPIYKDDITVEKVKALREEGYTLRKIAEILNCSPNTVRNRLKEGEGK